MNNSTEDNASLRTLYFTRTAVQLGWAVAVFMTLTHPVAGAVLLVAYPLWDVACTLYDVRRPQTAPDARRLQWGNAGLGLLTAAALAATAWKSPGMAVAVFGGWALAAGLVQLLVGIARRSRMGGQWAMILSGAQSAIAGATFIAGGLKDKLHVKDLGGYAVFGAVYFLVAGLLLLRKARPSEQGESAHA